MGAREPGPTRACRRWLASRHGQGPQAQLRSDDIAQPCPVGRHDQRTMRQAVEFVASAVPATMTIPASRLTRISSEPRENVESAEHSLIGYLRLAVRPASPRRTCLPPLSSAGICGSVPTASPGRTTSSSATQIVVPVIDVGHAVSVRNGCTTNPSAMTVEVGRCGPSVSPAAPCSRQWRRRHRSRPPAAVPSTSGRWPQRRVRST